MPTITENFDIFFNEVKMAISQIKELSQVNIYNILVATYNNHLLSALEEQVTAGEGTWEDVARIFNEKTQSFINELLYYPTTAPYRVHVSKGDLLEIIRFQNTAIGFPTSYKSASFGTDNNNQSIDTPIKKTIMDSLANLAHTGSLGRREQRSDLEKHCISYSMLAQQTADVATLDKEQLMKVLTSVVSQTEKFREILENTAVKSKIIKEFNPADYIEICCACKSIVEFDEIIAIFEKTTNGKWRKELSVADLVPLYSQRPVTFQHNLILAKQPQCSYNFIARITLELSPEQICTILITQINNRHVYELENIRVILQLLGDNFVNGLNDKQLLSILKLLQSIFAHGEGNSSQENLKRDDAIAFEVLKCLKARILSLADDLLVEILITNTYVKNFLFYGDNAAEILAELVNISDEAMSRLLANIVNDYTFRKISNIDRVKKDELLLIYHIRDYTAELNEHYKKIINRINQEQCLRILKYFRYPQPQANQIFIFFLEKFYNDKKIVEQVFTLSPGLFLLLDDDLRTKIFDQRTTVEIIDAYSKQSATDLEHNHNIDKLFDDIEKNSSNLEQAQRVAIIDKLLKLSQKSSAIESRILKRLYGNTSKFADDITPGHLIQTFIHNTHDKTNPDIKKRKLKVLKKEKYVKKLQIQHIVAIFVDQQDFPLHKDIIRKLTKLLIKKDWPVTGVRTSVYYKTHSITSGDDGRISLSLDHSAEDAAPGSSPVVITTDSEQGKKTIQEIMQLRDPSPEKLKKIRLATCLILLEINRQANTKELRGTRDALLKSIIHGKELNELLLFHAAYPFTDITPLLKDPQVLGLLDASVIIDLLATQPNQSYEICHALIAKRLFKISNINFDTLEDNYITKLEAGKQVNVRTALILTLHVAYRNLKNSAEYQALTVYLSKHPEYLAETFVRARTSTDRKALFYNQHLLNFANDKELLDSICKYPDLIVRVLSHAYSLDFSIAKKLISHLNEEDIVKVFFERAKANQLFYVNSQAKEQSQHQSYRIGQLLLAKLDFHTLPAIIERVNDAYSSLSNDGAGQAKDLAQLVQKNIYQLQLAKQNVFSIPAFVLTLTYCIFLLAVCMTGIGILILFALPDELSPYRVYHSLKSYFQPKYVAMAKEVISDEATRDIREMLGKGEQKQKLGIRNNHGELRKITIDGKKAGTVLQISRYEAPIEVAKRVCEEANKDQSFVLNNRYCVFNQVSKDYVHITLDEDTKRSLEQTINESKAESKNYIQSKP